MKQFLHCCGNAPTARHIYMFHWLVVMPVLPLACRCDQSRNGLKLCIRRQAVRIDCGFIAIATTKNRYRLRQRHRLVPLSCREWQSKGGLFVVVESGKVDSKLNLITSPLKKISETLGAIATSSSSQSAAAVGLARLHHRQ